MNQKPTIAIVSDAVFPWNKGGKEKRIHDISTRLAAEGYSVHVYCMHWWKGPKTTVLEGVTFHAISAYHPLYAGRRRSISEAVLFSLSCLKLLFEPFDIIDIDHIPQVALFTTKLVCLLRRKRMVVTWHEVWGEQYWKDYLGSCLGRIAYWVEKASVQFPDIIISVSHHTTSALREVLKARKPIVTVPNGLNIKEIRNGAVADRQSDIIFAGRLLAHKNVNVLLRAVAIMKKKQPNISFFVVGDGPEKKRLKKLAEELKIEKNVTFLDFFEKYEDLYSLMRASKVFALPSTREGFGIMVIEANACGLPVVTIGHPHNAAKDLIIHGENGTVCDLDEREIADALEKELANRKDAGFYKQYSDKYDWDNLIHEVKRVYGIEAEYNDAVRKERTVGFSRKASIILLTYNSSKIIRRVLDGIAKQRFKDYEVLCIDSSSTDNTVEIIKEYPFEVITIKPEEFGHAKTRNFGARCASGEFVVFLTHDSVPEGEDWLSELLRPFDDPKVAGVYGQQVPRKDEKPLDRYFQLSLYGSVPLTWEGDNWKIGDNIFSDANSAVRKSVLLEHPYDNKIIVSEDYEWAARVLNAGYKIIYSTTARVIHSHTYTLRWLFQRNFDIGVSYRTIYSKKQLYRFVSKGVKVFKNEIRYLWDSGYARLIPMATLRDAIRFVAIQLGKNENFFPKSIKRNYLSAQKWYWK